MSHRVEEDINNCGDSKSTNGTNDVIGLELEVGCIKKIMLS